MSPKAASATSKTLSDRAAELGAGPGEPEAAFATGQGPFANLLVRGEFW